MRAYICFVRKLALLSVPAAAMLLAGCVTVNAGDPSESQTVAPTRTTESVQPAAQTGNGGLSGEDRAFFAQIQDPIWTDEDPQSLIDLGHLICSKFEDGTDKTELLQAIIDGADNDGDAAVEMMYASVSSYCPDYLVGVTGPGGA